MLRCRVARGAGLDTEMQGDDNKGTNQTKLSPFDLSVRTKFLHNRYAQILHTAHSVRLESSSEHVTYVSLSFKYITEAKLRRKLDRNT